MTSRSLTDRAHEGLHRVPGLPEHGEAARLNHRGGLRNRPLRNRPLSGPHTGHGHRPPRVLAGWQEAIARFFSVGGK
ncbi:MAG TPA: hypothetical protein VMU95_36075 [Trebonia sp.]|nr:hypothetical protein [Trebonia sp.]